MKPNELEVVMPDCRSDGESVVEKKTKLSLNQKRSRPPTSSHVAGKKKLQISNEFVAVNFEDRRIANDEIECSDNNACGSEKDFAVSSASEVAGDEDAVPGGAFTSAGESLCPLCRKAMDSESIPDHWKKCLQKYKLSPPRRGAATAISDNQNRQSVACEVCQKDLTHMNETRRNQHVNRCMDSTEQPSKQQADTNISWECPFCGKMTIHLTRVSHLKRCGTLRRVPFQKLREIRQMLDRQAAERQSAGLPVVAALKKENSGKTAQNKNRGPKPKLEPRSAMEADLQMGVALSASLKEDADRRLKEELKELGLNDHIAQPAPSGSSVGVALPETRRRKKGICLDSKELPLLVVRTTAERNSIIAGKVQNVVLEGSSDEEEDALEYLSEVTDGKRHSDVKGTLGNNKEDNQFLSSLIAKNQPLLKLSATADPRNTNKSMFYLSHLHPAVVMPTKIGAKGLQTARRNAASSTQTSHHWQAVRNGYTKNEVKLGKEEFVPSTQDALRSLLSNCNDLVDESDEEVNRCSQGMKDRLNVSCGSDMALSGFCLDETVRDGFIPEQPTLTASAKILQGNSTNQLLDGLASMVASEECSDVRFHLDDGILPGHLFVLCIRSKELYQEVIASGGSCQWPVSSAIARWFLMYIYTGCVDSLTIEMDVLEQVHMLAKRYRMPELTSYCAGLLSTKDNKSTSPRTPQTNCCREDSIDIQLAADCNGNRKLKKSESDPDCNLHLSDDSGQSCNKRNSELVSDMLTVKPKIGDESVTPLPESGSMDIASDPEGKPPSNDLIPKSYTALDDSSSSLWSQDSDVMELDNSQEMTEVSAPALLEKIASTSVNKRAQVGSLETRQESSFLKNKLTESNQACNRSEFVAVAEVTVPETTINDCLSTTTDLFADEDSLFVVPGTVTCRKRYIPGISASAAASSVKEISETWSAVQSIPHLSPSRVASTSTPVERRSGLESDMRVRESKFCSVSSIEASPTRRVRVSSSFERSPSRCYGAPSAKSTPQTPSSPFSPVFLSISNNSCRSGMDNNDLVDESLACNNRKRKRKTAHCISFNSDSDKESLSSPSKSPKSVRSPSMSAQRSLASPSSDYHLYNKRELLCDSTAPLPPAPPNSRCSIQKSPYSRREMLENSRYSSSPTSRNSLKTPQGSINESSSAFAEQADIWQDFHDDGGFNNDYSFMAAEEMEIQEVNRVYSPMKISPVKVTFGTTIKYHEESLEHCNSPVVNNRHSPSKLNSPVWISRRKIPLPIQFGSPAKMAALLISPGKMTAKVSSPGKMATKVSSPGKMATKVSSPGKMASPIKMTAKAVSPAKKVNEVMSPAKRSSNVVSPIKKKRNTIAKPKTPITPMPAYEAMPTPEIAVALKKYGVRQFTRKKATAVLKHIYEETHPLVTDSEHESSFQKPNEGKDPNSGTTTKVLSPQKYVGYLSSNDDDEALLVLSQSSSSSAASSSLEIPEESYVSAALEDELSASQEQTCKADLGRFLHHFFSARKELRHKILLYEPLNMVNLQDEIKASGMKISQGQLMDFLDEQCITFTMGKVRPTRRRRRKSKAQTPSPKRKKKS